MKVNLLKKIGIIGFGNMGSAIARKLSAQKDEYEVFVFDKEKDKLADLGGIKVTEDARDLTAQVEVIILAVKPQDFNHILKEIKGLTADKLIISIAAGITTSHIEKILGEARVIRVMPNIGAKVAESVTCLCKGALATDDDLELVQELFYYLGAVRIIEESMMDAATAISGSGPAYIFYFIENSTLDPENIPEHARHDMMRRSAKWASTFTGTCRRKMTRKPRSENSYASPRNSTCLS